MPLKDVPSIIRLGDGHSNPLCLVRLESCIKAYMRLTSGMGKFRNYVLTAAGFVILTATVTFVMAPYAVAQAVKAALVRDIDNAARNAVQFVLYDSAGFHNYVVPADKILVIDECSSLDSANGLFAVNTMLNGQISTYFIPVFPGGGGYIGGRTTQIYADPGSTVYATSAGTLTSALFDCSGHLVSK